MRTPKEHLSHTQINLWETNRDRYIRHYFHGEEFPSSVYMDLGKQVAEALDNGESDDEMISLLISTFPAYPKREVELRAVVKDKKEKINLLAIIDGLDTKKGILGEYKTGKKWTQKQADNASQLRFYHLVYFLKTGKMLNKVYLHWAETHWQDDILCFTGNVQTFEVKHTRLDLLKEQMRVKRVYKEISEAWKRELATIN